MVELAQPQSFSVYRGQSRTGQGEGPQRAVAHGEQYLKVEPALYNDELLDAIRPWMTLDSDPADHQRLNDQLEGWSLFSSGNYCFVARLASAGIYDRRAAYFTHARAWDISRLSIDFDPGLYLGRTDAFDDPWENAPGRSGSETASPTWTAQIKQDPDTAARFLGHLLQAMAEGYPLIIAAPVSAFVSRGALHGMICFARAGLPSKLRNACRIRIYSRMPDLFIRHLGTNLLAVPEDAAGSAIAARQPSTLIDAQGRRLAGKDLDDHAHEYGAAVAERAIAIPEGLTYFSERYQRLMWNGGLPTAEDARAVQITYNVAFARTADRRGELLRKYLPRAASRLAPGFDWERVISADEWKEFPDDALIDQLLADTSTLSESGREFLRKIEDGAASRALRVDDTRLAQWWNPAEEAKVQRLVELLAHTPALVSDSSVAERTREIPIGRLPQGAALAGVLRAESRGGLLTGRASESAPLAAAAADWTVFDVLTDAAVNRRMNAQWAADYVRTAPLQNIVEAARRWSDVSGFFESWENAPKDLLERLCRETTDPSLAPFAKRGLELDPVRHLDTYLLAAELLARIHRDASLGPDNRAVMALRDALPQLKESAPAARRLREALFDPKWICLQLDTIDLALLLGLALDFEDEAHLRELHHEIDSRMRRMPKPTTETLVRTSWWYFWRTNSRLNSNGDGVALLESACAWMTSRAWSADNIPAMEAWNCVMSDLPQTISGELLVKMRGEDSWRRLCPWIPPFEEHQLDEITDRAGDFGALIEIVEALESDSQAPRPGTSLFAYVLQKSRFAREVTGHALQWLAKDKQNPLAPLSIQESARLWRKAGHLRARALKARFAAIAELLKTDSQAALEAATDEPNLWSDGEFLSTVAEWMNVRRSLLTIGRPIAGIIDTNINGTAKTALKSPSSQLVEELVREGYSCAARLLSPALEAKTSGELVEDKVMLALINGQQDDECWKQLATAIDRPRGGTPHPITALASRICSNDLSREQRQALAERGWRTFEAVAARYPRFMDSGVKLPAFDLAASMLTAGSMGHAALQVLDSQRSQPQEVWWWESLLRSIREFRRYGDVRSADDRDGYVLTLMFDVAGGFIEQRALESAAATVARRDPEWETLSEFAKGRL